MMEEKNQLLVVRDLVLHFRTMMGPVQAVDKVNFSLAAHKAVVILGESGCGKSSLAKAILRLLPKNVSAYTGSIKLCDAEIMGLSDEDYRRSVRWVAMSMVPQAAMNALNPVLKVSDQVSEPAMIHLGYKKNQAMAQVAKMFQHVGVPLDFLNCYPFELSGGMRQRIAIAMALVTAPRLVILDEPTSALDVLTQANIFNVLKKIKHELGTSFILITHDIATSSELADAVAVMYAGQVVEESDAQSFFAEPLHPYSRKLMASVPRLYSNQEPEFIVGQPPSLLNPPSGCRFAARCPKQHARCSEEPPVVNVNKRNVKCWLYA